MAPFLIVLTANFPPKFFNLLCWSLEHLKYPYKLVPLKIKQINPIINLAGWKILKIIKINQIIGVKYKQIQKTLLSLVDSFFSFLLSKIQTSSPFSFTSFHHLKPTSKRPDKFFTTQKSAEPNSIVVKYITLFLSVILSNIVNDKRDFSWAFWF